MKQVKQIINYLKDRITTLGSIIDYYDTLERDKGYLTTDQMKAYEIAVAQFRELDSLINYIDVGK